MPDRVQRIRVDFEYPVLFTRDALDPGNDALVRALSWKEPARRHRFLAVVDEGVARAWPDLERRIAGYAERHADRVELGGEPILVRGGEATKNDGEDVGAVHRKLDAARIDRQSFVVAIGGGAVLDMAGYAAATAHRGVRMVRVPTTVLSQADSGVGVKNGVNLLGKKNFVGTFAPPFAVVVDTAFLATLEPRDAIAGMAEAVKVALLRDASFFDWIRDAAPALSARDPALLEALVERCADLHLQHIATSGDPFEFGSARPLDFGHWMAHKLETLTDHRLRHGEAVAIGMAADLLYAASRGICERATAEAVLAILSALGLPLWDEALEWVGPDDRLKVLAGLAEFREHLGGELTVTLVTEPGRSIEVHEMDEADVVQAIATLRKRTMEAW